jgi:hypothetical protein
MSAEIQMHDVVALEELHVEHFETGQPIVLRRGQMGAVVMTYDGSAYEVEFADREGRPHAIVAVSADKLIVLQKFPDVAPP